MQQSFFTSLLISDTVLVKCECCWCFSLFFPKLTETESNIGEKKEMDMRKYVEKMVFCRPDEK